MTYFEFVIFYISLLGLLVTLFAISTSLSKDLKYSLIKKYIFNSSFLIYYFSSFLLFFVLGVVSYMFENSFFLYFQNIVVVFMFLLTSCFIIIFFWKNLDKNVLYEKLRKKILSLKDKAKRVEILRDILSNLEFVKNERNYLPREEFEFLKDIVKKEYDILDEKRNLDVEFLDKLLNNEQFLDIFQNYFENLNLNILFKNNNLFLLPKKQFFLCMFFLSRIRNIKIYEDEFNSIGYFLLKPLCRIEFISYCQNSVYYAECYLDNAHKYLDNIFIVLEQLQTINFNEKDKIKYLENIFADLTRFLISLEENFEGYSNVNKLREKIYDFYVYYYYLICYKVETGYFTSDFYSLMYNVLSSTPNLESYFLKDNKPQQPQNRMGLRQLGYNKLGGKVQDLIEIDYDKYYLLYIYGKFIEKKILISNVIEVDFNIFTREFVSKFYNFSNDNITRFYKSFKN